MPALMPGLSTNVCTCAWSIHQCLQLCLVYPPMPAPMLGPSTNACLIRLCLVHPIMPILSTHASTYA